jgi:hypothetical protein
VFLFGDATHVKTAARIARDEMGFEVVGLGCYNREFARSIRALGKEFGVEPLITDDYLEVEKAIEEAAPEMILGTQMERHIGKRLGIPCAVISAPVHVQDFPRAIRRRWAGKARTSSSTPGSIRWSWGWRSTCWRCSGRISSSTMRPGQAITAAMRRSQWRGTEPRNRRQRSLPKTVFRER